MLNRWASLLEPYLASGLDEPPGPRRALPAEAAAAPRDLGDGRLARLRLLYDVGRSLSSIAPVDELLHGIVTAAAEVIQARASSLMLVDDSGECLVFAQASGEKAAQLKGMQLPIDDQSVAGWVAQNGEPLVVDDVREVSYFTGSVDRRTKFKTRSILAVPLQSPTGIIGVLEVLNKVSGERFSQDDVDLLVALAGSAAVAIQNARLYEQASRRAAELAEKVEELERTYKTTMRALSALLDTRDSSTAGHTQRVTMFTLELARKMGISNPARLRVIEYGALLHDMGKIGVPDSILHKPASLTPEEWEVMRKHPEIGYRTLKDIEFLQQAVPIVLYHHERYDGNGYPCRVRGEAIPLDARIFAVADAFDALTSDRPYKAALSYEEARDIIVADSGTHFDPQVVEAFLSVSPDEWQAMRDSAAGHSLYVIS